MAFNTKKHDKVLQRTLNEIQAGAFDNIKSLEIEIADLVAQGLPLELVRPQIIGAYNKYSESIRTVAQPLIGISQDYLTQSSLPVQNADLVAQTALLAQSQDNMSTAVNSGAQDILTVVTLGTVAGVTTASLVNQVRGRISGIQMESSSPDVRREQRKLRRMMKKGATGAELAAVVATIKRKLPGDVNTSASLNAILKTTSENTVGQFDGAFSKARANNIGTERFRYEGGIVEKSRPFCREMLGQQLSTDEIQNIWDSGSWAGKSPGDPFVVRGGYNCLHYWVPIENEED